MVGMAVIIITCSCSKKIDNDICCNSNTYHIVMHLSLVCIFVSVFKIK